MTPDQNRILAGLAREDLFTVVHEQVLTDTARFADVLLPATTVFEQRELHKSYGHYAAAVLRAGDRAASASRWPTRQLFARLARAMGFERAGAAGDEDRAARATRSRDRGRLRRRRLDDSAARARRAAAFRAQRRAHAVRHRLSDARRAGASSSMPPPCAGVELRVARAAHRRWCCSARPPTRRSIRSSASSTSPHPRLAMHPDDAAARGVARRRRRCACSTISARCTCACASRATCARGVVTLARRACGGRAR